MKKICVIGLGYIGLPTATMFAVSGYKVVGVDVKKDVVETINQGNIHIEEPGLSEMVKGAVSKGNLKASTKPEESDVYIIAVPTPLTQDKKIELKYLKNAIESLEKVLKKGDTVIVESTIAPRTTEDFILPILEEMGFDPKKDLYLSHCPERVLPGQIINELMNNNRVIGGTTKEAALKARKIYESFVNGEMYITDATTAEMVKLMENTFRDVNIALVNELAKISKKIKIDIWEAVGLANKHPRVNLHKPGPGVGGHCLAIDPWFIVEKAPEKSKIIKLSRDTNNSMPGFVVKDIEENLGKINNPKIAILGITYKGNVDDLRESPVLDIIDKFEQKGYDLGIYDPYVKNFKYETVSLENAVKEADLLIVGADHRDFKYIFPDKISELMRNNILYDTKNILDHKAWEKSGFKVMKLGGYNIKNW